MVRPATPPKVRSGIGSTVRSWLNLPIASASESFSAAVPDFSVWTTERASAPARTCWTARAWSSSNIARMAAVPGLSASPILSWRPVSILCFAKRPAIPPAAAPMTVAASSGGAARPTRKPTEPP